LSLSVLLVLLVKVATTTHLAVTVVHVPNAVVRALSAINSIVH
jgi:hypothetical protein